MCCSKWFANGSRRFAPVVKLGDGKSCHPCVKEIVGIDPCKHKTKLDSHRERQIQYNLLDIFYSVTRLGIQVILAPEPACIRSVGVMG